MNKYLKKYIDMAWAMRETKPLDNGYFTSIKKFKGFYCWYPTKEKLKKQGKSVLQMWCEILLQDGKGLPSLK
jgi:predicted RNase H-like HicB family nuclease